MLNKNIGYMICETAASEPTKPVIVGDNNNRVTIEAVIQDMNVKNRNGRFYSDDQLSKALKDSRIKELLESGNMFGEAGHPMSKDIGRQQTIDPTNISHKFTKIWTEGNDIKAHIRGSANRLGEDFNAHILDDTKVSFSLRAMGTVNNTSRGAEVENIKIITWDWVVYPSHKRAYMDKIVNVNESVILGESNNLKLQKNDKGIFVPINNDSVINYIKHESANLKSILESFDTVYDSIQILEGGRTVQLTDRVGSTFVINLESYIQNEIMNYCLR